MMARWAPLKGAKVLMASPLDPTKNPVLLESKEPSAEKVFRVSIDFTSLEAQDCENNDKKGNRIRGKRNNIRFIIIKYRFLEVPLRFVLQQL